MVFVYKLVSFSIYKYGVNIFNITWRSITLMNKYTIIKKHQREKLLEFTAQELVQNKGIDQQNIENKSEFVQRSVGIVS